MNVELESFLKENPGYLKWNPEKLADKLKVKLSDVQDAFRSLKGNRAPKELVSISQEDYEKYLKFLESNKKEEVVEKLSSRIKGLVPFTSGDKNNVLVIGDIHEPFCLDDYLNFCRYTQEQFNCGTVIFIGDIIDNHYSSFHTSELDTTGPNAEFDHALKRIQEWYAIFPEATVILGNHDRIIHRQAKASGISDRWFKSLSDALKVPNWKFVESIVINDINYNHGEGGTATTRMKNELQSQVQGHLHSEAYVQYACGLNHKVFGMQVGCGIDRRSYAFAYGKDSKKPFIGCGVVLNNGELPIVIPMKL
jgi:hypothetical protein